MKHFWQILDHSIDWTSLKIRSLTLLGDFSGVTGLPVLSALRIATTILYNGIRIYKELKKR